MKSLHKQSGAAIIIALFIVALVAAAAVAMIERLRIDTRRTELLLNHTSALYYAEGSIAWAKDTLANNTLTKKIDQTPIYLSSEQSTDSLKITSVIFDAQGYFNINTLIDSESQQMFIELLQILSPDMTDETAKNLTQAIADWIQPGLVNSTFDQYYAKLKTPYRAPHQSMVSISELRLIKGVSPLLYHQLSPYLLALPANDTAINVNNASIPLLMSLAPKMSEQSAQAIKAQSKTKPFVTNEDFLAFEVVKNNAVNKNKITTVSSFFLLKTNITQGDQTIVLYTLLKRNSSNPPKIDIVWQMEGTL